MASAENRSSLRITFAFVLSAMVALTASSIVVLGYFSSRAQTLDASHSIIGGVADATTVRVHNWLGPARTASELTALQVANGAIDPTDLSAMERHLFGVMQVFDGLDMCAFGNPDGGFVMVKRSPQGALDTKLVEIGEAGRSVVWRRRQPGAALSDAVQEPAPADTYDPRTRPWYRSAADTRAFSWSDVYIFWTSRMPGLTASMPVFIDGQLVGVASADIGLREFSAFLSDIEIGESGVAVLADPSGRLIASPHPEDLIIETQTASGAELTLRALNDSLMPQIVALGALPEFKRHLGSPSRERVTVRYETAGDAYIGAFEPIEIAPGADWTVLVVALEDDFLGEVKQESRRNGLLGLFFVIVGMFVSLAFARWFSRSLRLLTEESDRIRNLDFTGEVNTRTPFREVYDVLDAFAAMKTGLRAFQKYLPLELVRILLERHEEPRLGGEQQELTLWFSDIQGFTSFSELLGPERMAIELGGYLGQLSVVIHDNDGTVVEYVGDEIFAFWGAPLPVDDPTRKACVAALAAQELIASQWGGGSAGPNFETRMAIHVGTVAVGHFGAADRMYYGAIGDSVNLCSRLEGANKHYGTKIIVSGQAHEIVAEDFAFRLLDRVIVVGRRTPTTLYELLGHANAPSDEILASARRYEEGLALYFAGDFQAAIPLFEEALRLRPDDEAGEVMIARCSGYLANPPEDWEGVYRLTTK